MQSYQLEGEDQPSLARVSQDSQGRGTEHLFRLFIGWVPKHFTEQDLEPLFQQFGDVKDIIILKDKVTGQPRGCAFVSYATKEEAEKAISSIDRTLHLPGALCPLEVRFARSHQYIQAGEGPEDNRQLFFARASVLASEADIQRLFAQFGEVEDVNLFRERRTNLSRACGFVTMTTREAAVAAMDGLDEKHIMDGATTPIAIKWADPELQIKKRRALEDSNAENRMLFFAKVLRSASEDDVKALFSCYGSVHGINLFRAFQGAPTSKGCGLITMGSNEEAAAAIAALDCKYTWPCMDMPMVVKWMDAALQKKRREEHLMAMRQGLVPSMSMTPEMWLSLKAAGAQAGGSGGSRSPGSSATAGLGAAAAGGMASPSAHGKAETMVEAVPMGCAEDAYKLFVGNIPKHCTEALLRPLFESVGQVVELVVVRDKVTHESKGSAFVWYYNKGQADAAIAQFDMRQVLVDPAGEQERPLVVRRANTRKAALPTGNSGMGPGVTTVVPIMGRMGMHQNTSAAVNAAAGMMEGLSMDSTAGAFAPVSTQMVSVYQGLGQGPFALIDTTQLPTSDLALPALQTYNQYPGMHSGQMYSGTQSGQQMLQMGPGSGMMLQAQSQQQHHSGPLHMQSMDSNTYVLSSASLAGVAVSTGTTATNLTNVTNVTDSSGSNVMQQQAEPRTSVTVSLSGNDMQTVTMQIYAIQTMSGAEFSSQAVGPGLFYLTLTGTSSQVATAQNLVGAVLTQGGAGLAGLG